MTLLFVTLGSSYFVIDKIVEKEIKSNLDSYLNNSINLKYDAGISGFFVPTIKNLVLSSNDESQFPGSVSLSIDKLKLNSYLKDDYNVSFNNISLEYDKESLYEFLNDNEYYSISDAQSLFYLDYINNIDLLLIGKCSNLQCDASNTLNFKSLFIVDQNFHIKGSEALIEFYLNNLFAFINPEPLDENPFLIFEMIGLLGEIDELSYRFNYNDQGLFENTNIKNNIKKNLNINDLSIEQASFGFKFNDQDINLSGLLDTSIFKSSALIDYEFDSYKLMIDPDQSLRFSGLNINIVNYNLDEVLWSIYPDINKDDTLFEIDNIIDEVNQSVESKQAFSLSREGIILSSLTGEKDPLNSLLKIRKFFDAPKEIDIEYKPKRPIGFTEMQEMLSSPEWPIGMKIKIQ